MAKKNTYKRQVMLIDLAKRCYANETGVKSYLSKGGIELAPGAHVQVDDLKNLRELNETAFNEMIMFLYPELFPENANAEGDEEKKGLSDADKKGIFDLFGNVINTAGDALKYIYGPKAVDNGSGAALQQQSKDMVIILSVAGVAVAILAAIIILVLRRKK